ncbi:MAG TPA: hypothetical protein VHE61_05225 [Opitutaceae bacterium]|nr:hypothetical protein [Opitutaceae bacterium]
MRRSSAELELHLRICGPRGPLFGPGKRQLLALIAGTASLSEAARRMDMSYMRAWTLVRAMNREWRRPLVELRRGGHRRGGAAVTPLGAEVLRLYDAIAAESRRSTRALFTRLAKLR